MDKIFKTLYFSLLFISYTKTDNEFSSIDLTIVGQVRWSGSLERLPISLFRVLKKDFSINLITTRKKYDLSELHHEEKNKITNPNKTPGNVAILFDTLWETWRVPSNFVPEESYIKIAYSMLESTAIPEQWVNILNGKFDIVVVPDEFHKKTYTECGVTIPLFVLPHGIELEGLIDEPSQKNQRRPFVFGSSGVFMPRKNHMMLIDAFLAEFGDNENVQLKIHGRGVFEFDFDAAKQKIAHHASKLKKPNVELIHESFSTVQYTNFLKSLDCYVLLSKGEGFSITPREALALGKPTIVTNNTAHKTIADTGFVYAIPSSLKEPAYYSYLGGYHGYNFNCTLEDVRKALRTVYENYQLYLNKAQMGQKWVQQYSWNNVKESFANLIKPKQLLFGNENKVTERFLMTSSPKLYRKYQKLLSLKK